jgi:hypothetical protein
MGEDGRIFVQIFDGRGPDCEWSQIIELLHDLNELHQDRLRRIDEAGGDAMIRAKFEESGAADLKEVNALLKQILERMEQEAAGRV